MVTGARETLGAAWLRAGAEEVVVVGPNGVKGAGGRGARLRSAR